jgi:hypothetical protein
MTKADIENLSWYANRVNGPCRGRISGESRRLLKAGVIRITWTSMIYYNLTITEKGRQVLAAPAGN